MQTFSALVKAALSGADVVQRYIFRATLPSATYAASDAPDTFVWDNGSGPLSYVPLDAGLQVTLPTVQTANRTDKATLAVSATNPEVLAQLFDLDYRAAPCDIALLLFDPATGAPGEEVLRWRGRLDVAEINDQPAKADISKGKDDAQPQVSTLSVTVAPQTIDMKRASGRTATDVDQRLFRDTNDSFFQDVALVGVSTINWGIAGVSSPAQSATNAAPEHAPSGLGAFLAQLNARTLGF